MDEKPKLTSGELMMIFGKALIKAGEELDDDGKISIDEIPAIVQVIISETIKEMGD